MASNPAQKMTHGAIPYTSIGCKCNYVVKTL